MDGGTSGLTTGATLGDTTVDPVSHQGRVLGDCPASTSSTQTNMSLVSPDDGSSTPMWLLP